MTTAATPITTADALARAGDIGRCELVRGELLMMSPAGPRHGGIANWLGTQLTLFVHEHDLGRVFAAETGFKIATKPDTVRAPDVAFVRKDRLHLIPDRGFFPGSPDLAAEVLSPDDPAGDVLDKVNDWLAAGCRLVWVVDPARKTVALYSPDAPVCRLREDDTLTGGDVVPGFELRVGTIFFD